MIGVITILLPFLILSYRRKKKRSLLIEEKLKKDAAKKKWNQKVKEDFNNWLKKNNMQIPGYAIKIDEWNYLKFTLNKVPAFVWRTGYYMYICPDIFSEDILWDNPVYLNNIYSNKPYDNFVCNIISINDIKFYKMEGSIQNITDISGGEIYGGGSSIKGAVVGGILAGEAGAIIGSRKEVRSNPIRSRIRQIDNRILKVYFEFNEKVEIKEFPSSFYDVFLRFIPEKSYDYVASSRQTENINSKSDNKQDVKEKLLKIEFLHKEGMLSEEEYQKKRKEIIDSI